MSSGAVKDVITQNDRGPGAWSDSIGNAFLAPYELNADKSTWTANGTKGPIHEALKTMDVKTYVYQGGVDANTMGNVSRYVRGADLDLVVSSHQVATLSCLSGRLWQRFECCADVHVDTLAGPHQFPGHAVKSPAVPAGQPFCPDTSDKWYSGSRLLNWFRSPF